MPFNSFYYEAIKNRKKENVTSYADESWYMRYVGGFAEKIYKKKSKLEEYMYERQGSWSKLKIFAFFVLEIVFYHLHTYKKQRNLYKLCFDNTDLIGLF